ncbi:Bifunctional purine biosynthetic protein ade1 [Blastocladiella emersonii ATCC 22665]|nr:Bifunctional purine biosynthetic protein ade1 [Blastocladiella emersonii ATCC 22665]
MNALTNSECPDLKLLARGKVRDLYDVDEHSLLFVATDRLSAFDVIMKNGIPDKGKILTGISVFWFGHLADVLPNHLITANMDEMPAKVQQYRAQLDGRCLLVKKLTVLPIEAIVRGYITGSGWKEYQAKGTVCDIPLPAGLVEAQQLPTPLFTPSTKAEIGDHDENIHPSKVAEIIGADLAAQVERAALALYSRAAAYARERNIIIADTKFEFGVDANGTLHLIDEVLTPDSSRFWPADEYAPGRDQNSFDKQYVRNYLLALPGFDKKTGVALPDDVIAETQRKYQAAMALLTGPATKKSAA